MGKRTNTAHVTILLLVTAIIGQCAGKPSSWAPPAPPIPKTPSISPDQLGIDCAELAADPNIPAFLIQELCSSQAQNPTVQAEEEAENAAAEEIAAEEAAVQEAVVEQAVAEEVAAEETAAEDAIAKEPVAEQEKAEEAGSSQSPVNAAGLKDEVLIEPKQGLVSFFRTAIQKLADVDGKKVSPKEFWVHTYQEAGAPKFSRHPTFFEILSGIQDSVDSFRSESSWWQVVRRLKDLTSDSQWKRLEAALVAAHGQDASNLWKVLGAAKAIRSAIKTAIKDPECRQEGVNPDPEDCREFYFCFRQGNRWKSKDAKCPKHMEFSPSRLRCVWAPLSDCQVEESDSGSDSDSNSSEILERVFRHGPAAFRNHHH